MGVIKKWFEQLSLSEKSVALTTLDKDLVQLFKTMYKYLQQDGYEGGEYAARLDRCDSVTQADA